ncbi:lysophospholipase [Panus rudis PR-1116 ss-1]|nr:lysophospholipase [Panus rudis PR-1116 ss-1]
MSGSSLYTETWLAGPDGHQFYTRTYAAPAPGPRAVILFVHGFAEHIGRYEHVHIDYPKRGITLFSFDQRGFGRTALDKEHRSKDASYGKTSWKYQSGDIEWWAKYLTKEYPGVPLFLMGHSMGGGLSIAFPTRTAPPPSPETVKLLRGVIASSPLIQLPTPKPKWLRWTGAKLATLAPYTQFPADVPAEHLSRNPAANEANLKDPLIKRVGTLRGLDDMLSGGERLLESDWQHWPKELPILFIQGTADKVTSFPATEEFFKKVPAQDKKLVPFPDAYHELVHEIDGIPAKLFEECVSWIEAHLTDNGAPQTGGEQVASTSESNVPESKL